MIVYLPAASPSSLVTSYLTVSSPRVPATVAVNSGSFSPNTFDLLSAVTVTGLCVTVNWPGVVFTTTLSVTSTPSFSTVAVPSNTVFVYSPTSAPLVTAVNPDTV